MTNRYSRGKRRLRKRRIAITILLLVALTAASLLTVSLIANRQTLDGAKSSDEYFIDGAIASVRHTETQRFYTIDTLRPDGEANKLPEAMTSYIAGAETDFRAELDGLLAARSLSRKDKSSLTVSYTADVFEGFVTYTVTADTHITGQAGTLSDTRRFAVNRSDGSEYTAETLFDADYNYTAVLASKIAAKAGGDDTAALINSMDKPFDDNLFMTSEGLRIEFAEPVGDVIPAGGSVTVDYKYIYYGLSFELPDEYKPPEPNPIDPKKEKVVALTFDDGPHGGVTPKLLNLLDKYDAKATFFVVGYNVEYHSEIIKDMAERGHTVAIHSTNHDYLTKMTDEEALADIDGLAKMIYDTCGVNPYLMRAAGGNINKHLAQLLGRPAIMWDVDPQDWKHRDGEYVSDFVLKHVQSGDIVLSHDIYASTYDAYAKIIPALAEQGYRFVTVDELLGITDPSIEGAYAGEIIYYRELAPELRAAGKFN